MNDKDLDIRDDAIGNTGKNNQSFSSFNNEL